MQAELKKTIIDNGGYQNISDVTGISKSTLARMAANQTEPKLKDDGYIESNRR
ncbi:tlcR protein [Vibrio cholerae HC-43A1]|nr:tlcR protein [Vibrio cholerae HC-43A1]